MQPKTTTHTWKPTHAAIAIGALVLLLICICGQGTGDTGASATQRHATATVRPTVTPQPTLTAEQIKEQPIQAVTMSHHATFTLYNGSLTVTDDIGSILTGKGGIELAKQDIYNIERAVWSHWPDPLVIVNVQVTAQGFENGQAKDALIAWADLLHDTEHNMDWTTLTADSAWGDYDTCWTASV